MATVQEARSVSLRELHPDSVLDAIGDAWQCTSVRAQFQAKVPLVVGWYRVRLVLNSHDRHTIRKRADLTFEDAAGQTLSHDSFAWNRTLNEVFLVQLPQGVDRLVFTLTQSEGTFTLNTFEVRKLPATAVTIAAMREKLRLISAFGCMKPVLKRGLRMLVRGEIKGIARKLTQGLLDGRAMRLGGYRANASAGHWMKALALKSDEADAAWWRRHALPTEEAERIRTACDAWQNPEPIAVLLPVLPEKLELARLAALSVRRQIYPHWELLLACAGSGEYLAQMNAWIGADPRVRITLATSDSGLSVAVARAIQQTTCERIVVLPTDVELAEDALYRFAQIAQENPKQNLHFGPLAGSCDIGMSSTRVLADAVPECFTPQAVLKWIGGYSDIPSPSASRRAWAHFIEERPLADSARVGDAEISPPFPIVFAANMMGLSGWDHLAFALLTGLPSLGVQCHRHPKSNIRPDLVPPRFLPISQALSTDTPELIIAPPFLVDSFSPNARSVIFTMWETDRLRPHDVEVLNRAGLILVPSHWSAECFRASGVFTPIEIVPLGYDPLIYHANDSFPKVCTFGTAGALVAGGMRKNAQHIVNLFRGTFPTEADVRLRVKITPTSPAIETHHDARIDVVRAVLPHAELARWYRSLSAYVNGSFGEGFGLHLIEAMACGRALISTEYSGQTAFFDSTVGYSVPYSLVPVQNDVYTGHWAIPSDHALQEQMRRVYADATEAQAFGAASAARAKQFTWKNAGKRLVEHLRAFAARMKP